MEGFVISAHDATAQVSAERELSEALSLPDRHLGLHGGRDPGGRHRGHHHRLQPPLRRDLAAPRRRCRRQDDGIDARTSPSTSWLDPRRLHGQDRGARPPGPRPRASTSSSSRTAAWSSGYSRPQRVDGEVVGRVYSFRDVTDRKRLEDELAYRAFHDSLTGLANKALFQDRLDHALARIERSRLAPGRALHRPRRLQDGQRQPRPRRGGPAACAGWRRRSSSAAARRTRRLVWAATSSPSSSRTCVAARLSPRWPSASSTRCARPSARDQVGQRGRQHRHRLRRGRHHQRPAAAQRRHRHVPGQGAGQGPVRGLPRRDARPRCWPVSSWRRSCARRSSTATSLAHYQPMMDLQTHTAWSGSRRWCDGHIRNGGLVDPRHVRAARRGARSHRRDRLVRAAHGMPPGARSGSERPGSATPTWMIEHQPLGRPACRSGRWRTRIAAADRECELRPPVARSSRSPRARCSPTTTPPLRNLTALR